MTIANLALKSFRNRKLTVLLTVFSIALSVALLITIEKVRVQAKDSFTNTISGTDLIVGARTSSVNLLLSSVFQMGTATAGINYQSYQSIVSNPMVVWSIPFALGDSHKNFQVMGTNLNFFTHYKYGTKQSLKFATGEWFKHHNDVVIGHDVARSLNYNLGDEIIVAHGGADSFIHHQQHPFTITGVLNPTSTPIDRTVFVSLTALEQLHVEQKSMSVGHDPLLTLDLTKTNANPKANPKSNHNQASAKSSQTHPDNIDTDQHSFNKQYGHKHHFESTNYGVAKDKIAAISGFYLGLQQRPQALTMMQTVNNYKGEPLMAIMPGVALLELWGVLSIVEQMLFIVSLIVVLISLASMLIILLNSLNQRRREMAILRAIGARPKHIFSLMMGEALAIIMAGLILGLGCLYAILFAIKPFILKHFGIYLTLSMPTMQEWTLLLLVGVAGIIISVFPSIQIYRYALSDGMSVKN